MATIEKFEDLEIWQLARIIYNKISPIVERLRIRREYRFSDQMKSSSGSVMDNIAEGFGRAGRLEFINSLGISTGETCELQSQLYRCLDDQVINTPEFEEIYNDTGKLKGKISTLVTYLNECEVKGLKFKGRHNNKSSNPNTKP
jgi:four helix bundle protein